jgi:hypothetical protein
VSGRIDQVQLEVATLERPRAGRRGGLNRDAALLFFFEEVHGGGAFVHFADLVVLAGVVQDALGDGGLTGVDVSADAEVTDVRQISGHR